MLSQYVAINAESDLTLSDGSSAHRYSISITPDQLHRLNAPIDKGFDGIIITTKQQGITYFIIYASELGKMSQFENVFQNILDSVRFGSVGFTGTEFNSPKNGTIDSTVTHNNPAYGVLGSAHLHAAFAVKMNGAKLDFSNDKYQVKSRYMHVENGDGDTLHRHATGVPVAEFFRSIKMNVTDTCFTDDNGTRYCSNGKENLEFYINGNKTNSIADYIFDDDDRILIVYGDSPIQVKQDLDELQQSPYQKVSHREVTPAYVLEAV